VIDEGVIDEGEKETRGVGRAARCEDPIAAKIDYGLAGAGEASGDAIPPSAAAFL
jgi:hypothetical protein